ncbi:zinc finger, C3HC4 type (RING finger) domain-containing protein [Cryptosporidium felis]|nr:zinc finger, C3HC4 type (RING finger) domain-containing protein [Cryptosporidium felis]
MAKGRFKSSINSSKAISLLGESKAGVATSLWGIFSEFNTSSGDLDTLHTQEQLNISSLHSAFVPIFTNISKKDCSTRKKGLVGFRDLLFELLENPNSDLDWEPILSNFTYIYIRVGVYDSDVKVRKLSNECLSLIHKNVGGKRLQKFCNLFFPALWLSCNDPKPDVSKSALECLEKLIGKENKERLVKLVVSCFPFMFELYGRLLSCNIKNIKNELNANVSSQYEQEELFDRITSTSLASIRKVLEVLRDDSCSLTSLHLASHLIFCSFPLQISEIIKPHLESPVLDTLEMGSIWKYISPSYSSVVRVDAIQLLTFSISTLQTQMTSRFPGERVSLTGGIPQIPKIFSDILKCLDDSTNSNVQIVAPGLFSAFSKAFPEIWYSKPTKQFRSPLKHFSKVLWACLGNPNQLSCRHLFTELPQILASIPFDFLIEEFSEIEKETLLINEILNAKDFYFNTFCELMAFLNEGLQQNNLPLLCLIPLGTILHLVKFVPSSEDSTSLVLGTPNSALLSCSLEAFYTVMLHFLVNKLNDIGDHLTFLKEFLINYYSKLFWTPVAFILTLSKNNTIQSSSLPCPKAQAKINEQFSNMFIQSIYIHTWSVEQCRSRNLEPCLSNLNIFLTGYLTKYYMSLSKQHLFFNSGSNNPSTYQTFIFLELCSALNIYDSEFIKNIFLWFKISSHETFLLIEESQFETVISRSKLINRAITGILLKFAGSQSDDFRANLDSLFLQVFEDYLKTISERPTNLSFKEKVVIHHILDYVFLPFILNSTKIESEKKEVLEKVVSLIIDNLEELTSIIMMSFINKLLSSEDSLCKFLLSSFARKTPEFQPELLEGCLVLFDLEQDFLIKTNQNKAGKNGENQASNGCFTLVSIKECTLNFLKSLCETSIVNSHLFSNFLMSLLLIQLKAILKSGPSSNLKLNEMSQIKEITVCFVKNVRSIPEKLVEIFFVLIQSENDFWFQQPKARKIIIPIIDTALFAGHKLPGTKLDSEILKLEKSLLSEIFEIGFPIVESGNYSIHKMILLADRNANLFRECNYTLTDRQKGYLNGALLGRIWNTMAHISEKLNVNQSCSVRESWEVGFKIREFLRVYTEIVDFSYLDTSFPHKENISNPKINQWLIVYIIKHLFISEKSLKLLKSSRELSSLEEDITFGSFKLVDTLKSAQEVESITKEILHFLISTSYPETPSLEEVMNNFHFFFGGSSRVVSRLKRSFATEFLVFILELIFEEDICDDYLDGIMKYLDSNFLLNNYSESLFLALKNKELKSLLGVSLPTKFTEMVLQEFDLGIRKFSETKETEYSKFLRVLRCILPILGEDIKLDLISQYTKDLERLIDSLTDRINNSDIIFALEECELYQICDVLVIAMELVTMILCENIKEREIQDDSLHEHCYSGFEISRVLVKLSSTVHYLVGQVLEVTFTSVNAHSCNLETLNDYSTMLLEVVINSLDLSRSIYQKLRFYSEQESTDDNRFSTVTIQLETNTLNMFDKFLGLISTILASNNCQMLEHKLEMYLEHITRIGTSEALGKKWILSIQESKLGSIKGNAMEISKLLTTNSLELHSLVLLILKGHNWYNSQYEYSDLKSAIFNIEKLEKCIREYLISKNEDESLEDLEESAEDHENDQELTKETRRANDAAADEYGDSNEEIILNFERGIEVIASHWRRLIGPCLAQQLLETYLSTINIECYEQRNEYGSGTGSGFISLNSLNADISQRLGCWCFILPKLISEDFVICTFNENPKIKTIERNLTPCIESLLELNPIVVGQAIIEKQVNLRTQANNEFLPSCLDSEDISICQALLYLVKKKNSSENLLDEMVLKNTTFIRIRELIGSEMSTGITQKSIKLPLIYILVELAFQTLVIIEDYSSEKGTLEATEESNSCQTFDSKTNWIATFRNSSNIERRKLLTADLEEILQLEPNQSSSSSVWSTNNLSFTWLLATRIILSLTTYFPRILREIWLCNSNNKTQAILQKLVLSYFSPIIIPVEINHIPFIVDKLSNSDKVITFDHNPSSRTIKIDYHERGFNASLSFTFSQSHPLVIPKVNLPSVAGVSKKQNSHWLISVIKAVRYKNVTHAILTWINNLSLYLDGVEDCLICYSIVHPQYRSLPRKRCGTCNNIFHSECIYKWFRTSNKTTCPLCISIMQ